MSLENDLRNAIIELQDRNQDLLADVDQVLDEIETYTQVAVKLAEACRQVSDLTDELVETASELERNKQRRNLRVV